MKQGANQIQSGYDKWKRNALRCCLNITSDGRLFQKLAPETGKARLLTVEKLNSTTASWLEEADWSLCRDGTSMIQICCNDECLFIVVLQEVSYEPAPRPLPPDWSAQTESVLLTVNLSSCGLISGHSSVAQNKPIDPGLFLYIL